MTAVIHVIGLGVKQQAELNSDARTALDQAGVVFGSERQLATVKHLLGEQQVQPLPPLTELAAQLGLAQQQHPSVAILASGDPLFYGIGSWLKRHVESSQLAFYPAISSLQAVCHALGLALQDVDVLSLHGRPVEKIRTRLAPDRTLLILTDQHSTPQRLAQECLAAGFDQSELTVCASMGYRNQKIQRFPVTKLARLRRKFDPLHVSVIEVRGRGSLLPVFPGIADEHFHTGVEAGKGMITKRAVRLNILSLLQPGAGDVIWDIGAGCGSVAVELAYWTPKARVLAVEQHAERLQCLEINRQRFGVVDNLIVVDGRAPTALAGLDAPNKIFIGGSDGELPTLLQTLWEQLPLHSMIVGSAVTETSKAWWLGFWQQRQQAQDADLETLQVAVSPGSTLAGQLIYRPNLPVSLFRFIKTGATDDVA
ncbi:bifunctional cobalt-precorrin-7 (C(5))-methyltransferase/cobalt-precorrin-6B (C(15))-methyltransferase [Gynuella sunshinyii]|uniref:Precorrin-6B methylase 1 n=1 Tax=Gynuella sunshinyii YC6258 TaxID=1445510 RepID=A0A0C5UXZ8_9GAMM|nr:bifunctional cobalt-precorrin-7 (C(5))-methyltransferase/cobalt-precorrin-6B (C(15))-methyltransferase [Gynuella sunshinyii]AJQ92170.1 precorrin-6B methylase 1 [Gynuella sunshinyii YC6258]